MGKIIDSGIVQCLLNKHNKDPEKQEQVLQSYKKAEESPQRDPATVIKAVQGLAADAERDNRLIKSKMDDYEAGLEKFNVQLDRLEGLYHKRNQVIARAMDLEKRFKAPVPQEFYDQASLSLNAEIQHLTEGEPARYLSLAKKAG